MLTTPRVNANPLKTIKPEEQELQHNIPLLVRIRDDNLPYGRGTSILFKGDDDLTALDKVAIWAFPGW